MKAAQERFWKGKSSEADLLKTAAVMRATHWQQQKAAGIGQIPSNDFSLYDQTLDISAMLGAVPERYRWKGGKVDLSTYFAMARGAQKDGVDVSAAEMTKWFDTNYHYIVPEFAAGQKFSLASTKAVDEFNEAKALGIITRPAFVGPVTYLLLGKNHGEGSSLDLLNGVLPVYVEVLKRLEQAGAEWVQFDEPALVLDLDDNARAAYAVA